MELKAKVMEMARPKAEIGCPVCGKRLFDWMGPPPSGCFDQQHRCCRCGRVWISSEYIRKSLTSGGQ